MPHPRLPAAPLKRVLLRLQASQSLTWDELADRVGVSQRQLCRIFKAKDLSEWVADRISCRIGLHPLLLWPKEWSRIGRPETTDLSQHRRRFRGTGHCSSFQNERSSSK
jgi:hypothetical protein